MNRRCTWFLPVMLLVVPIALALAVEPTSVRPDVRERLGATMPLDMPLRDHHGEQHRLGDVLGERATLLVPAYYRCPQLCGLNLHGLTEAFLALEDLSEADGIGLLVVSFDPRDDPALARDRRRGLVGEDGQPDWTFTTLAAPDCATFLHAIGWDVVQDPGSGEFAHPAGAVILTADGRIARYIHGLAPRPEDLRFGLLEAGEGTIGDAVDQMLLLCYRYDPSQRRYGLFVGNFLRVGALLVMLLAGGGLVYLVRRRRQSNGGPG